MTADRGYGEQSVDDALHNLDIRHVVIPAKADPSRPVKRSNTAGRSDEPSNGEPDVKAESAP